MGVGKTSTDGLSDRSCVLCGSSWTAGAWRQGWDEAVRARLRPRWDRRLSCCSATEEARDGMMNDVWLSNSEVCGDIKRMERLCSRRVSCCNLVETYIEIHSAPPWFQRYHHTRHGKRVEVDIFGSIRCLCSCDVNGSFLSMSLFSRTWVNAGRIVSNEECQEEYAKVLAQPLSLLGPATSSFKSESSFLGIEGVSHTWRVKGPSGFCLYLYNRDPERGPEIGFYLDSLTFSDSKIPYWMIPSDI